jgi:hypothetical protein
VSVIEASYSAVYSFCGGYRHKSVTEPEEDADYKVDRFHGRTEEQDLEKGLGKEQAN